MAARKAGKEVPDLETVICGRNRLENGSMMAWAKAYTLHNKVRTVKMVQNGIRSEGITHLFTDGLNKAASLQVLNMQDNTFTRTGSKALASAVQGWPELQELDVGDCFLTTKGWNHISRALAKGQNGKLEILRIQFNEIKAAGIQSLSEFAEASLPKLRRLELDGNKLSEEDPSILKLQEILEDRKGDFEDDEWGIGDLDELDDESEEESSEEEEELEREKLAETLVKEAEEAQEEPTVQVQDSEVDKLAKKLEKTEI